MTKEQKDWIDQSPYIELLRKWRFSKSGDPLFQGECGKYYVDKMYERRKQVGIDCHTSASKAIGW